MITIRDIVKKYFVGQPNEITVLDHVNLQVDEGEFVAIVGQSGSGKSTLMNIIGALDQPTSGEYILDGQPIQQMSQRELAEIRNKRIGFVFQSFNLIARSNAQKNIELPMVYGGTRPAERKKISDHLLELVGMDDRKDHLPNELSGGQKQRVAIARALANDPAIILADEPTGALDTKTSGVVMDVFSRIHSEEKKTIILITHSTEIAEFCPRVVSLRDGMIVSDEKKAGKEGRLRAGEHFYSAGVPAF